MNATPNSAPDSNLGVIKQTPFAIFTLFFMSVYPLRLRGKITRTKPHTTSELSRKKVRASARSDCSGKTPSDSKTR
jgi:hypothetical protein